jgi:hypothetical protein
MRNKIMQSVVSVLILASMMAAQLGQVGGNPGTPQGQGVVSLPLFTVNVTPVNQANVQTVGVQGSTTYYYWAVSQYQIGPSVCAPRATWRPRAPVRVRSKPV